MTVGIYGGSFDPIHTGHAIVANFVAQCGVVDEVWIMVSRRNPLKENESEASDMQRLQMAELVSTHCKNVKVSDVEMSLPTPSFTYDTLKVIRDKYPEIDFKVIIGSDSLLNFKNWKNHEKIAGEFGVIVYPRPGYPMPEMEPDGFTFLNGAPEFGISSSLVREYVRSGWNINYFVPPNVSAYIHNNKLYL